MEVFKVYAQDRFQRRFLEAEHAAHEGFLSIITQGAVLELTDFVNVELKGKNFEALFDLLLERKHAITRGPEEATSVVQTDREDTSDQRLAGTVHTDHVQRNAINSFSTG